MDEHTLIFVIAAARLIAVSGKGGKARNQFYALAHNVRNRPVLRVFIVRVACKDAARKFVHNILRRCFHNHIFRKIRRKGTDAAQKITKTLKFIFCRKFSHQKKICALLVAVVVVAFCIFYQINNVISAVHKPSGNRDFFSVRTDFIAHNITNSRKTNKYTSSVCVSKTALYIIFFI